jgi:putative membrane protein
LSIDELAIGDWRLEGRLERSSRPFLRYRRFMRFLLRLLLNGVAVFLAANLIPGISVAGPGTALIAGIILGFVNAIVRPVLFLLTLPFTILTLGLFIFVLNALCLALAAWLVPGFTVSGFGAALVGAIVISLVSWLLSALLIDKPSR